MSVGSVHVLKGRMSIPGISGKDRGKRGMRIERGGRNHKERGLILADQY
jgi:hypothetical protein